MDSPSTSWPGDAAAAPTPGPPLPFDLLRSLRRGGCGEVWLGQHRRARYLRAVKVVFSRLAAVEEAAISLYKQTVRIEDYCVLVPIEDLGQMPDGSPYYAMPLADHAGPQGMWLPNQYSPLTLEAHLENHGPLPLDKLLDVADRLLLALRRLHYHGLVHLDVKPANVLRVEEKWRLGDFGIMALRSGLRALGMRGTHWYMPPGGPLDFDADVHAFGKTLLVLATEKKPPRKDSSDEDPFVGLQRGQTLKYDDARKEDLRHLILRACASEPDNRPSVEELQREVSRLIHRRNRLAIGLPGDYWLWTEEARREWRRRIEALGVIILDDDVQPGSIIYRVELTPAQAEYLQAAVEHGALSGVHLRADTARLRECPEMPLPIALSAHLVRAAAGARERCQALLACCEAVLSYCATVQLSDYLRAGCPDTPVGQLVLDRLRRGKLTAGQWVEVVHAVAGFQGKDGARAFMPELAAFDFGPHEELIAAASRVEQRGGVEDEGWFARWLPHLDRLLDALAFLGRYPLLVPREVSAGRVVSAFVLMGPSRPPALRSDLDLPPDPEVVPGRMALLAGPGEDSSPLPLCPLLAFDPGRDVFVFRQCWFRRSEVCRLLYRPVSPAAAPRIVAPGSDPDDLLARFGLLLARLEPGAGTAAVGPQALEVEARPGPARGRWWGQWGLAAAALFLALLPAWSRVAPARPGRSAATRLVYGPRWVGYDPTEFDPSRRRYPSTQSMRADLRKIREAGFTGVVTTGSRGTLAEVPALAREQGLAVIMGVWMPTDQDELLRAAAQKAHVDGYCVGHNGLDKPDGYAFEDLDKALRLLRRHTGRPVSTTEEARLYPDNERLCRLGDWLFPAVHLALWDRRGAPARVRVTQDVDELVRLASQMAVIARILDRPLLLKEVAYPWRGAHGASREVQGQFFARFRIALDDLEHQLPCRIGVVFSSAFDSSWKGNGYFYSWDAYTGLLDPDGSLRPAGEEAMERRRLQP